MTDKSYSIIFSSPTGNTRLLADAIRDALPEENCNYFGVCENADTQSDILFIGFWTDKGTADKATLDLLEKLKIKGFFFSERRASAETKSTSKKSSQIQKEH